MMIHLLALATLTSVTASASTWDLNDVTYLLPLATPETAALQIRAVDQIPMTWFTKKLATPEGMYFQLVHQRAFLVTEEQRKAQIEEEQRGQREFELDAKRRAELGLSQQQPQILASRGVPSLTMAEFNQESLRTYQSVALVAVRVDPCFKDLPTDKCRKQLRAVWQPVETTDNPTTTDAAIHTFYDLTDAEFGKLLKSLQALKTQHNVSTQGLPLQVHPGFKNDEFSAAFGKIFRKYAPAKRITRIAIMELVAGISAWKFSSFDVKKGQLKPIRPARLTEDRQNVSFDFPGQGRFERSETQISEKHEDQVFRTDLTTQQIVDASLRLESPTHHQPGTIDCLSCHLATGAKNTALLELGEGAVAAPLDKFSGFDLTNRSADPATRITLRILGYDRSGLQIGDRVIHESASVATELNRLGL